MVTDLPRGPGLRRNRPARGDRPGGIPGYGVYIILSEAGAPPGLAWFCGFVWFWGGKMWVYVVLAPRKSWLCVGLVWACVGLAGWPGWTLAQLTDLIFFT